jgi:hypothetical protein
LNSSTETIGKKFRKQRKLKERKSKIMKTKFYALLASAALIAQAQKRNRNDPWGLKKLRLFSLVGITSIALTHAAWADPHGGGGGGFGGGGFSGGGHVSGGGGRAGPVGGGGGFRVAVASAQQPRRSVARADPLVWDRAEAELASACRIIGGLSTLMDELPSP